MTSFQRTAVIGRHQDKLNMMGDGKCDMMAIISYRPIELASQNALIIEDILKKGQNTMHAGKFLLGRVIMPCIAKGNLTLVVLDDPSGDNAVVLAIAQNNSKFVEVGSFLAVLNPCLTTRLEVSGEEAVVFCENPGEELKIVHSDHPLLQHYKWVLPIPKPLIRDPAQAEKLKEEGNVHFKAQNYLKAIDLYTKAIEKDPNNAVLYSNRSAAYALIERFREALEDAEKGLRLDKSSSRLAYRKAQALYLMKMYGECVDFCKGVDVGANKDLRDLKLKAEESLKESTTGQYDFLKMIAESKQSPFLNHADYFDPAMIDISKSVPGYKIGMMAIKDIPAGTLICASKALIYRQDLLVHSMLPQMIAEKLNADPTLGHLFYKHYAGSELERLEQYDERDPVQMARIFEIAKRYCYNHSDNHGVGFWMLPSFINSICVDSNCERYTIGDFMMVRSTRDVAEGEQLLLQLYPIDFVFEERDVLYRMRGNVCNCRLCLMESEESAETRRKVVEIRDATDLLNRSVSKNSTKVIDELARLATEAKQIRPNAALNPLADHVKFVLGCKYFLAEKLKEAIEINKEIYQVRKSLGWVLNLMELASILATQHMLMGNERQAIYWQAQLKTVFRILFGDDRLLFHFEPDAAKTFNKLWPNFGS